MKIFKLSISLLLVLFIVSSCQQNNNPLKNDKKFNVSFEQFVLDNGLNVIFHIDRSDPVVAVAITAHVGSGRELEGRTGFAHLFEHLLFLESENLGKGGLDKMSARIGGSGANGSTSRDRTNYFQTVPNDALEKMIWAEAEKIGYFINTVTDPVLAKEKQVVKNEKRQNVDNRPYGHTSYLIDKNLYPEGHPYSWQVIGSLDDIQNATLQDVKDFYSRWYVPNNVTLVVAGDFDTSQAKIWVEKYFSEIKRGEDIPEIIKKPLVLSETKKIYHEDIFARLPVLTIAWPSVYMYHPDSYALQVLSSYLSQGKKAPLYKVLVEDKQLTSYASLYNNNSEIAGQLMLSVRGYDGVNLNDVYDAVNIAFKEFEENGIPEKDLNRIKAGQEMSFYNSLSSVLGKGFQLAQYQIFAGDPGFINQDIQNILDVTEDDVMRVYMKYIKDKNYVATSFVAKGKTNLILKDSKKADIEEEIISQIVEEEFDLNERVPYERTPSSFDRTIEPPVGKAPELSVPDVWENKMNSGMKIYGIENDEVPLVQFNMTINGGLLLENPEKVGVSNLMARIMTKGTKNKTTEELEQAIEELGASIGVRATNENITISGATLARNYLKTMALVQEILLEPRWDEKELDLAKQAVGSQILQQEASPNSIAANYYRKLIYGENHILSNNILGTKESVPAITMDDLKTYYSTKLSPKVAAFHVVGDIDEDAVYASLESIDKNWDAIDVKIPVYVMPAPPEKSKVYFYDVPGAKQSVFNFGYPALAATNSDYYPATVMNYILGGGGFASQLTQQLREGKGYTYGIRSSFSGSTIPGPFTISSGVGSSVTFDAAKLVKDILDNYAKNYNEHDLDVTKGFLIKSNTRAFETMSAKLNMLRNISAYGWPYDYVKQREEIVQNMTVEKIQALARNYVNPEKMYYFIVGDAATQLSKLHQLGFGEPILLNEKN
ncbi:M16 family metallopeptidase [Bacteroidota bacterium]